MYHIISKEIVVIPQLCEVNIRLYSQILLLPNLFFFTSLFGPQFVKSREIHMHLRRPEAQIPLIKEQHLPSYFRPVGKEAAYL